MAFGAVKKYPIDLSARKAVGVSLPFNGNAVFKSTFTTKDAIRNNLINYLLTNPGEKIFNTNYGAGLRKYIFENINQGNITDIQNYIESIISTTFPNIQGEVIIQTSPEYNIIYITINYTIINTGINDNIQISLNNG
jgi:phage baseplate assembly protein W